MGFAVTQTINGLYFPIYFKLNPYNYLMIEQDISSVSILLGYVVVQLIVMLI